MKEIYVKHVAQLLSLKAWQVENCAEMFADGGTIPFISRYRKEKTGGMADAEVAEVKHWIDVFDEMEKRKATILKTISEAGALSEELKGKIENCVSSSELEDLYLPFRPKRRTRATIARELGLAPLAEAMWQLKARSPRAEARKYLKPGKVEDEDAALAGARDIIAEKLSETAVIRENLRGIFRTRRVVAKAAKGAESNPDAAKYRSYFEWSMPLDRIPSHNLLAILRASNEGFLSVKVDSDAVRCGKKIYYILQENSENRFGRLWETVSSAFWSLQSAPRCCAKPSRRPTSKAYACSATISASSCSGLPWGRNAPWRWTRVSATDARLHASMRTADCCTTP